MGKSTQIIHFTDGSTQHETCTMIFTFQRIPPSTLLCASLFLIFSGQIHAQSRTVSGTVLYNPKLNDCLLEAPCLDEVALTSEEDWMPPKAAVNIVVKSTGEVYKTDRSGRYTATVSSPDDSLMFLYIGHNRIEVPVEGRSVIDVQLTPTPLPVLERLLEQIMPVIEIGGIPDIDQISEKARVNRETTRDILWLVLGNRPFAEFYPGEFRPDYRFDDH